MKHQSHWGVSAFWLLATTLLFKAFDQEGCVSAYSLPYGYINQEMSMRVESHLHQKPQLKFFLGSIHVDLSMFMGMIRDLEHLSSEARQSWSGSAWRGESSREISLQTSNN